MEEREGTRGRNSLIKERERARERERIERIPG